MTKLASRRRLEVPPYVARFTERTADGLPLSPNVMLWHVDEVIYQMLLEGRPQYVVPEAFTTGDGRTIFVPVVPLCNPVVGVMNRKRAPGTGSYGHAATIRAGHILARVSQALKVQRADGTLRHWGYWLPALSVARRRFDALTRNRHDWPRGELWELTGAVGS